MISPDSPQPIFAPISSHQRSFLGVPTYLLIAVCCLLPAVIAYGLTSVPEEQVLAVTLAVVGAAAVLARPYWGLIFFIALLYARPEETFPELAGMRFTLIVSLVTLVGAWFYLFVHRKPIVRTPLNWLIIGFGVLAVASGVTAGVGTEAATDISKLVILTLLVLNLVRSPREYRTLITCLIVFTCYLAGYSIYLYYNGGAFIRDQEYLQSIATGIFADPNDLAATVVAGLALVLFRLKEPGWGKRALYLALAALITTAVFFTQSRGGLLAFLVVICGFTFSCLRRKWIGALFMPVLIAAVVSASPGRMGNFDSDEDSANARFGFWLEGVDQLIAHPLLGVGYKGFVDVNFGHTAHNSFVLCFAELGLPAYILWMGGIYYAYRRRTPAEIAPETLDTAPSEDLQAARLSLTSFLTAGFFLSRTYVPILYLLVAVPLVQQLSSQGATTIFCDDRREVSRDILRLILISLASILGIWLMAKRLY